MNPIGLLEQQEEFRRLSQQIHFLNEKARVEAKRKKWYFQLIRGAQIAQTSAAASDVTKLAT